MSPFLQPYNPEWRTEFERLRLLLTSALDGCDIDIQHVGSTAIPGLTAKPVLDIDIIIGSKPLLHEVVVELLALGYIARGEQGIQGRFAFAQASSGTPRNVSGRTWQRHHLYVCFAGSLALKNHLLFRDALLSSKTLSAQYGQLKQALVAEPGMTPEAYTRRKTDFILSVLSEAGLPAAALSGIREANMGACPPLQIHTSRFIFFYLRSRPTPTKVRCRYLIKPESGVSRRYTVAIKNTIGMAALIFRKALVSDLDYLLRLRRQTMDEHLLESGMALSHEDHVARISYLFDQARIIVFNGQDIGLLKIDEQEHSVEIVQIQIDPAFQGKGIGQQIVASVIEGSQTGKKEVSLSVLKANRAGALYQRMGFRITGEDDHSFMMTFDRKADCPSSHKRISQ